METAEVQAEKLVTTFGEQIALLRKKKGLTVAQAASALGIPEDKWDALEANQAAKATVFLWSLSRVLGVRPATLFK